MAFGVEDLLVEGLGGLDEGQSFVAQMIAPKPETMPS